MTLNGLCRYHGESWTPFELSHSLVNGCLLVTVVLTSPYQQAADVQIGLPKLQNRGSTHLDLIEKPNQPQLGKLAVRFALLMHARFR